MAGKYKIQKNKEFLKQGLEQSPIYKRRGMISHKEKKEMTLEEIIMDALEEIRACERCWKEKRLNDACCCTDCEHNEYCDRRLDIVDKEK